MYLENMGETKQMFRTAIASAGEAQKGTDLNVKINALANAVMLMSAGLHNICFRFEEIGRRLPARREIATKL